MVTLVAEPECSASSCVEEQCLIPVSPTTTGDVMDADMVDEQTEVAVSVSEWSSWTLWNKHFPR